MISRSPLLYCLINAAFVSVRTHTGEICVVAFSLQTTAVCSACSGGAGQKKGVSDHHYNGLILY